MLKRIVLNNFVHFKNKTVIALDVSQRGQIGKSTSYTKDGNSNFLNIFVGANFSGKSTVLELIRRCMTEKINTSVTSTWNKNRVAYAFCEFDLAQGDKIISGIMTDPATEAVYKILAFTNRLKTVTMVHMSPDFENFYSCESSAFTDISEILKESDNDEYVNNLLKNITDSGKTENTVSYKDIEPNWKSIEDKYIATFPLRGIGSIQWSHSKKINEIQRDENYSAAYERAEIISDLLSDKEKQFINADEEKRIFKYLTDSADFEFEKKNDTFEVRYNGIPFPLLKISEGIFEAKSMSLLLAHTQFQTLCLEDPDRGMHPQMIERLRTVLYHIGFKKTIIVVTHSPSFIDNMTIDKTHVFFRTKDEPSVCSVLNIGQSEELSKVADIETKKTLLFATRVLLVEGITDREVVQGILTENKYKKDNKSQEDFANGSTHQIISVGGKSNAARVQRFCNYINLPCLCLLDLDAAVKFDILSIKQFEGFNEDLQSMYQDTLEKTKTEFEQFFMELESQLKVFIWKDGALEDAILSSANCNAEIANALGKEGLNPKKLEKILIEPMDGNKRKSFYTELMKVDEIKRFIKFIEDNTCSSKPTGASVDTQ